MLYKANQFLYLLRETKKRYHENLNQKSVVENKLLWKTVKPLPSDKVAGEDLIENNVKTDLETANVFSQYSTES